MRYSFLMALILFVLSSCNKDKYTTAPQIKFVSVQPNTLSGNLPITGQTLPVITFHITDAEGDIGFNDGLDTAYIYVKNLLANTNDSFKFPLLAGATGKNFQCDVEVIPYTLFQTSTRPTPKTDTLLYEIYVKDFAKNKSNVIKTTEPVFFVFH